MNVTTFLTLPKTSNAFSKLENRQPTIVNRSADSSGSRKIPRLDSDYDSGSASRSETRNEQQTHADPTRMRLIGPPLPPPPADLETKISGELNRFISHTLLRGDKPALKATYENLYTACRYFVCVSKKGEGLYEKLREKTEKCASGLGKELSEINVDSMTDLGDSKEASLNSLAKGAAMGMTWLASFSEICEWFGKQVMLMKSVLTYLNQLFIPKHPNLQSIEDLSYSMFTSFVIRNPLVMIRFRTSIENWLTYEREMKFVERNPSDRILGPEALSAARLVHEKRTQIPTLIAHLFNHRVYDSVFETYYLKSTFDYYTNESKILSEKMKHKPKDFYKHVTTRIEEETKRLEELLPIGSWGRVKEVTEQSLMRNRTGWLTTPVTKIFMEASELESLAEMYRLYSRIGELKSLSAAFKDHVLISVKKIVTDVERDEEMVQRLLEFKDLANSAINSAFYDEVEANTETVDSAEFSADNRSPSSSFRVKKPNRDFKDAMDDAFAQGFKNRRKKPAEMIAKHLDRAMRKGQQGASSSEFEGLMDKVLELYRFTEDKDVFRAFYHRALAKRLLLQKSASDDFEKRILDKMKQNYDAEFGTWDEMFSNLTLSREKMVLFHKKLASDDPARNLSVVVLQRSAWPFSGSADRKGTIDLPFWMQEQLTRYTAQYRIEHPSRVLDWNHSLGTVTLKARFAGGTKDLSVSLYQGVILLLFNENDEMQYEEIKVQTGIEDADLRRTLQSLACAKKKVLKKEPVGKDVNNGDVFKFNADFTDPHIKVHINSIQVKDTVEESDKAQASIDVDRNHNIDAAVVRIMKGRKELTFEELKIATVDALRRHFMPDIPTIKKQIESLVEREYLRRHPEDNNRYLYVA